MAIHEIARDLQDYWTVQGLKECGGVDVGLEFAMILKDLAFAQSLSLQFVQNVGPNPILSRETDSMEEPPVNRMNCDEKMRLATIYEAATGKFSEAVKELQQKIGISTKQQYERLDRAANEARVKSEQARLALEQHIVAHRC